MNDSRSSFDTLVLPYLSDALALARWLTKNRADAEDVLQEACLRAFRSIGTYAGGNPRAWLLAIVRNVAYSWLQKNRRVETVSFDDLGPEERADVERGGEDAAFVETPETQLLTKANAEELRAAIESMPPEFRETLVLRDIHGLGYREIAQVTSAPIGTVMSRLSRARRHLVRRIGRPEPPGAVS